MVQTTRLSAAPGTAPGTIPGTAPVSAADTLSGSAATRLRLLDAAEELFATKGFEETSVRELTTLAHCNLAAANYHFGGKENLYIEMFRRRLNEMCQRRIAGIQQALAQRDASLESLLRSFVATFLEPLTDIPHCRRLCTLYNREMLKPRLPKGMFFDELIHPTQRIMQQVFDRFCPKLSPSRREICMHSIVGQALHVLESRQMYLDAGLDPGPLSQLSQMIDHIVTFSAAGIRAFEQTNPGAKS